MSTYFDDIKAVECKVDSLTEIVKSLLPQETEVEETIQDKKLNEIISITTKLHNDMRVVKELLALKPNDSVFLKTDELEPENDMDLKEQRRIFAKSLIITMLFSVTSLWSFHYSTALFPIFLGLVYASVGWLFALYLDKIGLPGFTLRKVARNARAISTLWLGLFILFIGGAFIGNSYVSNPFGGDNEATSQRYIIEQPGQKTNNSGSQQQPAATRSTNVVLPENTSDRDSER